MPKFRLHSLRLSQIPGPSYSPVFYNPGKYQETSVVHEVVRYAYPKFIFTHFIVPCLRIFLKNFVSDIFNQYSSFEMRDHLSHP